MPRPVPPGPRSKFPLQNELSWRKSAPEFLRRAAGEFGGIFRFRLRGLDLTFVSDPELVREVLVVKDKFFRKGPGFQKLKPWLGDGILTSEGEAHRRQRRMLQPSFHRQRIEGYAETMKREAETGAANLHDGQRIDLMPFIESLAFDIAVGCIFDLRLDNARRPFFEAIKQAIVYFDTMNSYSPGSFLKRWNGSLERQKRDSIRFLHNMVDELILARRQDTEDRGDLLTMLVRTLDEEGDGKGLSDQEVRDQVMTLLVAGFDTISSTITTTLLQLANNPTAEQAVVDEMKTILGGRPAGFAESMLLEKSTAAVSETLRLLPASWILPRTATQEVEIGGYLIPANATVLVSSYVNQRNPEHFPDPGCYDITRWEPAKKAKLPKFAYFPFGGGSRVCVGEQFAWMEANIVLASLLQRWRFEIAFDWPVKYKSTMSLRPVHNCPVIVRERAC